MGLQVVLLQKGTNMKTRLNRNQTVEWIKLNELVYCSSIVGMNLVTMVGTEHIPGIDMQFFFFFFLNHSFIVSAVGTDCIVLCSMVMWHRRVWREKGDDGRIYRLNFHSGWIQSRQSWITSEYCWWIIRKRPTHTVPNFYWTKNMDSVEFGCMGIIFQLLLSSVARVLLWVIYWKTSLDRMRFFFFIALFHMRVWSQLLQ